MEVEMVGKGTPKRNMKIVTCYLTYEQYDMLKIISEKTKVPVASLIREGVDMGIRAREDSLSNAR